MRTLKSLERYETWSGVGKALVQGTTFPVTIVPGLHHKLVEFKRLFSEFCKKPVEYRERWSVDNHLKRPGYDPDRGYIFRSGESGHDTKDMMHVRLSLRQELVDVGVIITPEEHRMLDVGEQIYREFALIYRRAILSMQGTIAEGMVEALLSLGVEHLFRILRYHPGYEFFAQPHCDLATLTFVLGDMNEAEEPYPGLILPEHDLYTPLTLNRDEVLIMNGTKSGIVSSPMLCGNFIQTLERGDWLAKDSLFLPTMHYAQSGTNNDYRYAFIFFGHCDIGLSGDQISIIQKRLTKHFSETFYQRAFR